MRQLSMRYTGGKIHATDAPEYTIRNYADADYEMMLDALMPLTLKRYTAEELDSVILKKPGVRPEGVFVVEMDNKLIGTATGYTHEPNGDNPGDNGGTLHMVSALPEAAGRRVGFNVCACVVNYLLGIGCSYVDLTTDDFRLPAIVTYARLGFRPVIDDEEMLGRWTALAEKLHLPVLTEEAFKE